MTRCDSCGMPLNDGTRGTEADGAAAELYCGACYSKGAFTAPDATAEQVRETAIDSLVAQGVPPLTATRLTADNHLLPRWS